jgi:hypothetical protein
VVSLIDHALEPVIGGAVVKDMRQRRQVYDAERARGGEIVLRTRWERVVFIAGLGGAAVLGLVLATWSLWH